MISRQTVAVMLLLAAGAAGAQQKPPEGSLGCGELQNHFGPFDYRTASAETKRTVEAFHFTEQVATLRSGINGPLGSEIDWTLRSFPNHPRALDAMSQLSIREKRAKPNGAWYTVECYFDRAFRFVPKDPIPHMLLGIHRLRAKQPREAVTAMERARELAPENANVQYNLGLAYLEAGDFDKAMESARIAYGMGYPLPGLRNRLEKAGKWRD